MSASHDDTSLVTDRGVGQRIVLRLARPDTLSIEHFLVLSSYEQYNSSNPCPPYWKFFVSNNQEGIEL